MATVEMITIRFGADVSHQLVNVSSSLWFYATWCRQGLLVLTWRKQHSWAMHGAVRSHRATVWIIYLQPGGEKWQTPRRHKWKCIKSREGKEHHKPEIHSMEKLSSTRWKLSSRGTREVISDEVTTQRCTNWFLIKPDVVLSPDSMLTHE